MSPHFVEHGSTFLPGWETSHGCGYLRPRDIFLAVIFFAAPDDPTLNNIVDGLRDISQWEWHVDDQTSAVLCRIFLASLQGWYAKPQCNNNGDED